MRGRLWILLVGALLALTHAAGIAQEAGCPDASADIAQGDGRART